MAGSQRNLVSLSARVFESSVLIMMLELLDSLPDLSKGSDLGREVAIGASDRGSVGNPLADGRNHS